MPYDWILGVLSDLRRFAEQNGMPKLAEQLHETTLIAAVEIANVPLIKSSAPVAGPAKPTAAEEA